MDLRTLLICFSAILTMEALALLLARLSRRAMVGTGWLAGSFALAAMGICLATLRGVVPAFLSIIVGNMAILGGYVLLHRAVAEFCGIGWRHLLLHVVVFVGMLAGITYFTYEIYDTQMRIVIVSLAFMVEAGLSALLLFRNDSDTRSEERFLGAVLLVLAALNGLRGGLTQWQGAPADLMHSGLIQTASYLAFILTCTAITFAFVWMGSARTQRALHLQATRDPLTGLLNRRGFLAIAPMRMRTAEQEGRGVLLFFADVDGLKQVNDTLGHHVGDCLLREAADVLREVLRASDSVARLGGDEFCALLSVRSLDDGAQILQRIEEHVQLRNAQPGRDYALGISAATVAAHPQDERSLEELLRAADTSMYATKRRRKQLAPSALA